MDFRLLGPLEVRAGDTPVPLGGAKQRTVLALLLLRAGTLVPADRLIDEVWADEPPPAARNVLQTYVSRLRKALGADRLEHRPGGYVLHAGPEELDVRRFEAQVATARRRVSADPASAARLYRDAEAMWRGPALDDLADQDALRGDIAHLDELRAAAIEERVVAELALGRHAELVPELEALTAAEPLREGLWAHLMTALYRSGRQADALAAYRRARALLMDELGLEPSPDLRRLEAQVLAQDPALDVTGRPLRGLELLERIGEGSFGVVHRAIQSHVGREVAVKVIRPALANDPDFIRRFEAEAQLVARVEHPHVVPLYDFWREPDGAFLVMRHLRGGSLREALDRGPLPHARVMATAEQVAAALAAAHRQGVVHRDIKPANILLDEDGNAYLSDFGIARDVAAARSPEGRGATEYVSPEEAAGAAPSPQADVYSLGLVLAEMLAGGKEPPARALQQIVRCATAHEPAERYPDASAVLEALAAAAGTASPAIPAGPIRNPYKGLRPFLEADAPDFRGRERLVRRLTERLAASRLLAVVGPSGSGKSSVVRAGLVPAVRAASPGVFVAEMVPGEDPFAELAAALVRLASTAPPPGLAERIEADDDGLVRAAADLLPAAGSELLLVVDQFDELFTRLADAERRARFLTVLRTAATHPRSRVRTVVTLRADVLDRPLAHAGFADVLREGIELVVPLRAEELEQAISEPARRVGVTVEAGLLAELVADTEGQPAALPLLQFTLAELFDRRDGAALTLAGYRALGGVAGAIARGAEEAYATLDAGGRDEARQLFLRLVEPDGGRRRVLRGELLAVADAAVVDAFTGRRLLSLDRDPATREPTVEIAHDALLTAWERLGGWVAASADDLRTQRRLAADAAEWHDAGRDPSFLLRGSRLERLQAWRAGTSLSLTPPERAFLEAAAAERDRLRADDASRAERERAVRRTSVRRRRSVVAVTGAAALTVLGLALATGGESADAERERHTAAARGLVTAALADLDEDAERGVLLALEAVERGQAAGGSALTEARDALHRAVGASRMRLRVPGLGGALDWSPDGTLFVTEGPEDSGLIDVRDARTGRSVRTFPAHDPDVNLVAFSPDGAQLATTGDDGTLKLWEPRSGRHLRTFTGRGPVWGAAFSPDGTRLAASWWEEARVRVFDVATGRRVAEIPAETVSLATSFSPDGRRLVIPTFDSGALVVDLRDGDVEHRLRGQDGLTDADWSPDGRWIATSSPDATVRIWDARTGRVRQRLTAHRSEVITVDWSADSRSLVTGSGDGTAKVWAVDRGRADEVVTIEAQKEGGGVWVAFSPDGRQLMTGDQGITAVKVWDVQPGGGAEWPVVPAPAGAGGAVAFTPDGQAIAVGGEDGALVLWDAHTGEFTGALAPAHEPGSGRVSAIAGGDALAALTGAGVRVWDPAGRRELFSLPARQGAADVAWSADGGVLAVALTRGVLIADRTGETLARLPGVPGHRLTAVAISPDGRLVASAPIDIGYPEAPDGDVVVHDWRSGALVARLPSAASALAFSHDGRRLATAPLSGPVRIWNARSGHLDTTLAGYAGSVTDVAFAPGDTALATGSADGRVRLWDPATGRQQLELRGHLDVVRDLAFSPDGSQLASSGAEGVVRVWALDDDELAAIARTRLTRGLTAAECRRYLGDGDCR